MTAVDQRPSLNELVHRIYSLIQDHPLAALHLWLLRDGTRKWDANNELCKQIQRADLADAEGRISSRTWHVLGGYFTYFPGDNTIEMNRFCDIDDFSLDL